MNVIPLPEIVLALTLSVIVMGVRLVWRRVSSPSASRGPGMQRSRFGRNPERIRVHLIASCGLLVLISIPLILELVPPNGVYGFRVSGTRSPEIWYPANEFMGWAFVTAALIAVTLQIMLPPTTKRWLVWAAFLMPIGGAVAASFAYLNKLLNAV